MLSQKICSVIRKNIQLQLLASTCTGTHIIRFSKRLSRVSLRSPAPCPLTMLPRRLTGQSNELLDGGNPSSAASQISTGQLVLGLTPVRLSPRHRTAWYPCSSWAPFTCPFYWGPVSYPPASTGNMLVLSGLQTPTQARTDNKCIWWALPQMTTHSIAMAALEVMSPIMAENTHCILNAGQTPSLLTQRQKSLLYRWGTHAKPPVDAWNHR